MNTLHCIVPALKTSRSKVIFQNIAGPSTLVKRVKLLGKKINVIYSFMNKQTFLDIEERALLNIDKCPLQLFCVTFIPSAFYKAPELEETGARLLNNNRLVICDIFA